MLTDKKYSLHRLPPPRLITSFEANYKNQQDLNRWSYSAHAPTGGASHAPKHWARAISLQIDRLLTHHRRVVRTSFSKFNREILGLTNTEKHTNTTRDRGWRMSKRLETVATMTCMKTLLMLFNFLFLVSEPSHLHRSTLLGLDRNPESWDENTLPPNCCTIRYSVAVMLVSKFYPSSRNVDKMHVYRIFGLFWFSR